MPGAELGSDDDMLGQPVPDGRHFRPRGRTSDLHKMSGKALTLCYRRRW